MALSHHKRALSDVLALREHVDELTGGVPEAEAEGLMEFLTLHGAEAEAKTAAAAASTIVLAMPAPPRSPSSG
eukprot:g2086.t1